MPPKVDSVTPEMIRVVFDKDPIGIHGRLTVIFRDLILNASRPHVDWLKQFIHDALRDAVNNFPSVIFVGEWAHLFADIDKEGYAVTLRFWAWGDDETHAMENLRSTFDILLALFKHVEKSARTPPAPSPVS